MATVKQAGRKRLKMSERAEQQLQLLFPDIAQHWLWKRKTNDGYTTLPRTLPIVMQAIDDQSKGQPAGHTLFCLWARSPDHPLVTIEHPATFASEAGFDGVRAVDTWRRRMKTLHKLGFIVPKKGPSGDFHYVLLINPNMAIELMHSQGLIQADLYARFLARLTDIGGYGDIETIRAYWVSEAEAAKAKESGSAKASEAVTANPAPPPPGPSVSPASLPPPPATNSTHPDLAPTASAPSATPARKSSRRRRAQGV